MPSISIDLKRDTGIPVPGTHMVKITKFTETDSETPSIWIHFRVEDKGDDQGKSFRGWFAISGKGRWKLDHLLDAVEAPRQGKMQVEDLINKTLMMQTSVGEWQGQPTTDIGQMWPVNSNRPGAEAPTGTKPQVNKPAEFAAGQGKKSPF